MCQRNILFCGWCGPLTAACSHVAAVTYCYRVPAPWLQENPVLAQQLAELQAQCQAFAVEAEALRLQVRPHMCWASRLACAVLC